MGCGKPSDRDKSVYLASSQQEHDELSLSISQRRDAESSGMLAGGNRAGLVPIPSTLPGAHCSWNMPWNNESHRHGNRSDNVLMSGFMRPDGLSNPPISADLNKIEYDMTEFHHVAETSCSKGVERGLPMNDIVVQDSSGGDRSTDSNNHGFSTSSVSLVSDSGGGYQMEKLGSETKTNGISDSLERENNIDFHGPSKRIDGSFLTLGIGCNTGPASRTNIMTGMKESAFRQMNSPHNHQAQNYANHCLGGDIQKFQYGGGGMPSQICSASGKSLCTDDAGVTTGVASNSQDTSPFHKFQTLEAHTEYYSSVRDRVPSFEGREDVNFSGLDTSGGYQGDGNSFPMPFSNSSMRFSLSECPGSFDMSSKSANTSRNVSKPASVQRSTDYARYPGDVSSESLMNSTLCDLRGSSALQGYSGQPLLVSDVRPAQAHGNALFLERNRAQVTDRINLENATSIFPRRLGIQSGATQALEGDWVPKLQDNWTAGNTHGTRDYRPVHPNRSHAQPPFATGRPQGNIPPESGSSLAAGALRQHRDLMLAQLAGRAPSIARADAHGSSLKRKATESPSVTPSRPHKRMVPQPVIYPSVPQHITRPQQSGLVHSPRWNAPVHMPMSAEAESPSVPPFGPHKRMVPQTVIHPSVPQPVIHPSVPQPVIRPQQSGLVHPPRQNAPVHIPMSGEAESPSVTPSGPHKRMVPQPVIHPSVPQHIIRPQQSGLVHPPRRDAPVHMPMSAPLRHRAPAPPGIRAPQGSSAPFARTPALLARQTALARMHVPATVPAASHITRQGFDAPPRPTGWKCLLCKRDLSFAPEGRVHQPEIPPAVAVLHCGHTFHDHCLHLITPEDQAKDPPCIPCAIGET